MSDHSQPRDENYSPPHPLTPSPPDPYFQVSLALLVGMVMSLAGCNDIRDRTAPTVTPNTTSPARIAPQQKHSTVRSSAASPELNRENYKAIALSELANPDQLRGNDPKAIALSTFGISSSDGASEGGSQDVTVNYPESNKAVVTITQTGLPDDSVGSIRYRVELVQNPSAQADQQWEMVWAGSQFQCQPKRGHQDWSKELCL